MIEILGNLYGQNDAPASWFRTMDKDLQSLGWRMVGDQVVLMHVYIRFEIQPMP